MKVDFFISVWLRNGAAVEFRGGVDYGQFARIRSQAGLNNRKVSVKERAEKTGAVGLKAKAGRYGWTVRSIPRESDRREGIIT